MYPSDNLTINWVDLTSRNNYQISGVVYLVLKDFEETFQPFTKLTSSFSLYRSGRDDQKKEVNLANGITPCFQCEKIFGTEWKRSKSFQQQSLDQHVVTNFVIRWQETSLSSVYTFVRRGSHVKQMKAVNIGQITQLLFPNSIWCTYRKSLRRSGRVSVEYLNSSWLSQEFYSLYRWTWERM